MSGGADGSAVEVGLADSVEVAVSVGPIVDSGLSCPLGVGSLDGVAVGVRASGVGSLTVGAASLGLGEVDGVLTVSVGSLGAGVDSLGLGSRLGVGASVASGLAVKVGHEPNGG